MQTYFLSRREQTDWSTWGSLAGPDGVEICKILERGADNPAHKRIPAGSYAIGRKKLWASRFDGTFNALIANYRGILWLPEVPGRSNIEIHTANLVQQLEGCLATGDEIVRDDRGDFAIAGGTSKPAYARMYPLVSAALDAGGAQLIITDI